MTTVLFASSGIRIQSRSFYVVPPTLYACVRLYYFIAFLQNSFKSTKSYSMIAFANCEHILVQSDVISSDCCSSYDYEGKHITDLSISSNHLISSIRSLFVLERDFTLLN
ncbi:hypothetical protein L6452_12889 [Arctium lappa]|uniref:Uncharacterized protein n=1 Tax=Arctium lappa TaxID=4217 RepID=A0ACB9CGQ0_ARCLA|nr:hypothetical protein L6452_12889 [Arctium lappa]